MDEDGYYIVSCPMFKRCHTYGETIEEVLENIKLHSFKDQIDRIL